jgi:DNA-binding LacI/PurR family transcriptional regulator
VDGGHQAESPQKVAGVRAEARTTLEEVAERAGVSRATASRVIRGESNVSDSAREAVLTAAAELRYSVNRAARSLVTRRSDSVAFLVAETQERMFRDPYFLNILRGAQSVIGPSGLQLVFAIASTHSEVENFAAYASSGHADGILLISLHGDDELPLTLENHGVPTVLNGRPMKLDSGIYYVDADNINGGRLATETLLNRGARRIATITGPMDMAASHDRLAGYRAALDAHGVPSDPYLIVTGDFSVEGGAAAMARLLDQSPDLDAVFCASDLTALGALQTLTAKGRRVPDDVAIIGFDDVPDSAIANPPLTTIRQPIRELGRTMAQVLLDRISGRSPQPTTVLPVELVRRDSA